MATKTVAAMPSTSKTDPALSGRRQAPSTVVVGVVLRPHGVRGALKVDVQSDTPERFAPGSELLLVPPRGRPRKVVVRTYRPAGGPAHIGLTGVDDRDAADGLRGARFEIEREHVPEAPTGLYYYFDLVGCSVSDAESGDLGEVVDVIEDGGGHLLRIRREQGEVLVPFVEAFIEKVDVKAGRIEMRLPPGLIEACASAS